ncbi:FeoA family protein [Marinomonas fungiae]|uniref:FeoA family protein n=1 Tax=Marinomonas fungiae TaxID=1137284 RepID=UPI003A94F6EF
MVLATLPKGQAATVHKVDHPQFEMKQQLEALGFDAGEPVSLVNIAPFGDPLQVKIGQTLVSIHRRDAQHIHLCSPNCQDNH